MQSGERKVTLDNINRGQYGVAFTRWLADYNDPSTFLNVFRSDSSENSPKYHNPDYDRILHQATAARTPQQVQQYFQQAEAVLADDTPVAPVYYEANATLIKPYVKGSILPLRAPCTIKRLPSRTLRNKKRLIYISRFYRFAFNNIILNTP